MKTIKRLVIYLQGKKTYIVSALAAFDGLWQYFVQHGMNVKALLVYLLFGGGLASLRAALSKLDLTKKA